uniref:HdeD family acid-resistance protein n=1 Tax=Rhodopseudomonas palustris (strain BisA53) TaxID=316055 RepID=Q07MH1_RHOP5
MTSPNDGIPVPPNLKAVAQAHWKALLIEGILLSLCGLAAVLLPLLASLAITILLGWMLILTGATALALTFWAKQLPGFWWSLLSAVVALVAGFVLLFWPVEGTVTLTLIVGAYFLAEGVVTIMYALEHRRELSERWGWLLAAGIADLLVAAVIISGFPATATWAIGLLVGLNLLFGGGSLIGVALSARPR